MPDKIMIMMFVVGAALFFVGVALDIYEDIRREDRK